MQVLNMMASFNNFITLFIFFLWPIVTVTYRILYKIFFLNFEVISVLQKVCKDFFRTFES